MDEIMRKKFKDMLLENKDKPVGQAGHPFNVHHVGWRSDLKILQNSMMALEEYGNFMTEKEAKKVVDGFIAFDGSRGEMEYGCHCR